MKSLLIAAIALFSLPAHAWDCSIPANRTLNVPGNECYVPPGTPQNGPTATSTSSASQGQTQGQGQTSTNTNGQGQTATGGKSKSNSSSQSASGITNSGNSSATGGALTNSGNSRSAATSSSAGGGGGAGGAGGTGTATSTQGNSQSSQSSTFIQASAPPIINPIRIVNCGIAVDAGASGVRGAGAFGITVTTEECWNSNYASLEEAAGRFYDACEMRRVSKTEQRAVKNGAKFADCRLPEPIQIERIIKVGPTEDDLALIRQHAIAEYIASQPPVVCPKLKPSKHPHVISCRVVEGVPAQ